MSESGPHETQTCGNDGTCYTFSGMCPFAKIPRFVFYRLNLGFAIFQGPVVCIRFFNTVIRFCSLPRSLVERLSVNLFVAVEIESVKTSKS